MDVGNIREEDLGQAWELWLGTGWNEKYQVRRQEFEKSWLQSPYRLCIRSPDGLAAIARANSDGVMYAMVHDVVVDPVYRGRGLGAQIISVLVHRLQADGIRCIQLMSAENQSVFYEKLGFEPRPVNKPGMEYRPKK